MTFQVDALMVAVGSELEMRGLGTQTFHRPKSGPRLPTQNELAFGVLLSAVDCLQIHGAVHRPGAGWLGLPGAHSCCPQLWP